MERQVAAPYGLRIFSFFCFYWVFTNIYTASLCEFALVRSNWYSVYRG